MAVQGDPVPNPPQHDPVIDPADSAKGRFARSWMQWFLLLRSKINVINALLYNLSQVTGQGFLVLFNGQWFTRAMQGPMSVLIQNADGSTGDPIFTLDGDEVSPGEMESYSTNAAGVKGWYKPALFESTGILDGGVLSLGGGNTFNISQLAVGWTDYDTNPVQPTRDVQVLGPFTGLMVPNIAVLATYVGISMPSGTVVQQSMPFSATQQRDIAPLGAVISDGVNLITVNNLPAVLRAGINQVQDLMAAIGPMNLSGNVIGPNGVNLSINKTDGKIFKQGSNFQFNEDDPHGLPLALLTAPTFNYRLSDGTQFANTTVIDPNNMETPLGTLAPVPAANRWTVQRISIFTSNIIRVQYGQFDYGSLIAAEASISTEAFVTEQNIAENGLLLAFLVVRDGATDLSSPLDAKFIPASKFGGAVGAGGASLVNTDSLPEGAVNLYFTDERAQDAVGNILVDSASINFTYDDIANTITADVVGGAVGTVTSVAATAPAAGFTIAGSPITTSGTFIFALSDDLAGLEGLAGTGMAVRIAANTWANRTLVNGAGITLTNPDGVAGNFIIAHADTASVADLNSNNSGTVVLQDILITFDTFGHVQNATVGTVDIATALAGTFQPLDATLTALAGANWATDSLPIGTGVDTVAQTTFAANTFPAKASAGALSAKPITDFGLSLVDDVDAAAALTTLGAAADSTVVHLAGTETITGVKTVNNQFVVGDGVTAAGRVVILNSPAGFTADVAFRSAGINRFLLRGKNAVAESGGDAGSNLQLFKYTDAGVASEVLEIERATGTVAFNVTPTVAGSAVMTRAANETVTGLKTFTQEVFIGTPVQALGYTPALRIEVDDATALGALSFFRYTNSVGPPFLAFIKGRGTVGAPLQALSGDNILDLRATGILDTGAVGGSQAAELQALATEDFTTTGQGTRWRFRITRTGTLTAADVLTMESDGTVIVSEGDLRVNTTLGLIGTGREIVVSGGTSGDVIGSLTMQGFRSANNTYGSLNYFHGATRTAAIGSYRDSASDAAGIQLLTKPTGGAIAVRLTVDSVGRLYGTSIHNNASGLAGATNQYIGSGTYTPVITNVANVAASTSAACQWMRVGNVVTVSGRISISTTAAAGTLTQFRISLPIASALAGVSQLDGMAGRQTAGTIEPATINSDVVNDEALFTLYSTATPSVGVPFTFTYVVL